MENVRICILNGLDVPVGFMDNSLPDALHYWNDTLHIYLKGSASTFEFTCDARHPDAQKIEVGGKIAFVYDNRQYYFNIMKSDQTETTLTATGYATALGLINTYAGYYEPDSLKRFADYVRQFDEFNFIKIGVNEIATSQLKLTYTSDDTLLARLFDLAEEFNAELEFNASLNNDYSLNSILLNVYQKHDESSGIQGIGRKRTDKRIRYNRDFKGMTKNCDISKLYTAICAIGSNDEVNLYSMPEQIIYDNQGQIAFRKPSQDKYIYAVQAKDRFLSSIIAFESERYISYRWTYTTDDQNRLFNKALEELKKASVPKLSYTMEGYFDCGIGDTFTIIDEEFSPPLYLEARITEMEVSFTNPASNTLTIDNFVEKQNEISGVVLSRMNAIANAAKESVQQEIVVLDGKAEAARIEAAQAALDALHAEERSARAETEAEQAKNAAELATALAAETADKTKYIRFYSDYGLAVADSDLSDVDYPKGVPSTIVNESGFSIYGTDSNYNTGVIEIGKFSGNGAVIGSAQPFAEWTEDAPGSVVGTYESGIPYHLVVDSDEGIVLRAGPHNYGRGTIADVPIPSPEDAFDLFKIGIVDESPDHLYDPRYGINAAYQMWLTANQEIWLNSTHNDVIINGENLDIQLLPTKIYLKTSSSPYKETLEAYINRKMPAPVKAWTMIAQGGNVTSTKGNGQQIGSLNLSSYKELMVTCEVVNTNRILASTIIPVNQIYLYAIDHGDGAFQARYNDSYQTGISLLYTNSTHTVNTLSLYRKSSDAYCRVYAR